MFKFIIAILGVLTITATPLFSEISLGEKLETQMWEDMKHRNFTAVEANIAKHFQSIHTFGTLTREAEIELIKDLYLGTYEISKVKVTENEDTIVVTYFIKVKEKIENQQLSDKPAPRLSVWKKIDGKWQWIAHANLKEIPTEKPKTTIPATKTSAAVPKAS
ncbi:MAG: nuclear transport factor 2 family protein [Parachlamydiaceae bacterium]